MQDLIKALLSAGSAPLSSEEAACDAVVAVRYPNGIRCPRCLRSCTRNVAQVTCHREKKPHRFTILAGTPFGTKRKPQVRALLLAMHAMSSTHTAISARAMARALGLPDHTTMWRHLHTLRLLVPAPATTLTTTVADRPEGEHVQLTGRKTGAHRAFVEVAAPRIRGEAARLWLNAAHHGVSARWLARYMCEYGSYTRDACAWLADTLARFLNGNPLIFRAVLPPALEDAAPSAA